MKQYMAFAFLVFIIGGKTGALDTESSPFIDHLIGISRPAAPELIDDGVLFTFSTDYRSVGIAFAHENFSVVHWFEKLSVLQDRGPPSSTGKQPRPAWTDPKVLFFVCTPPRGLRSLEYRLVINGLWTTDPLNPQSRQDTATGLRHSIVLLPERRDPPPLVQSGSVHFSFSADPGETVSVSGDFNNWDPFMYELRESAPGLYSLDLPLPAGTWRYVFWNRGRRFTDPANPRRVFDSSGNPVSEVRVE